MLCNACYEREALLGQDLCARCLGKRESERINASLGRKQYPQRTDEQRENTHETKHGSGHG